MEFKLFRLLRQFLLITVLMHATDAMSMMSDALIQARRAVEDAGGGVEAQERSLNGVGRETNTNIDHKIVAPLIEKNPGVYEGAARDLLTRHPEAEAISPEEAAAIRVKVRGVRPGEGLDEKLAVQDILQQRSEQKLAHDAKEGIIIDNKAIEKLVQENPKLYKNYSNVLNSRYNNVFSPEETARVRIKVKQGKTEEQAALEVQEQSLAQAGRNTNTNIDSKIVAPLVKNNLGLYIQEALRLQKIYPEAGTITAEEAAAVRVKVQGGRVGKGLDEKLAVQDILQQRAEQKSADKARSGAIDSEDIDALVAENRDFYESYSKVLTTRYDASFSPEETARVRIKIKQGKGMTEDQAADGVQMTKKLASQAEERRLALRGRDYNINIDSKIVAPLVKNNLKLYEKEALRLEKKYPKAETFSPEEAAAVRVKVGVELDEKVAVQDILQQRAEQKIADNAKKGIIIDSKAIEKLVKEDPTLYENYSNVLNIRYNNVFSPEETARVRVKVKQGMSEELAATDVIQQRPKKIIQATEAGNEVKAEDASQASIVKETTEVAGGTPEATAVEQVTEADTTTLKKLKQKLNKQVDAARQTEKAAQEKLDAIRQESDAASISHSNIEATPANKNALNMSEARLNEILAKLKIAQGNLEKAQIATKKAVRNRTAKIAAATVVATGAIAGISAAASK